ncbi:hypothetical protein H2198_004378 [Neophaeococcomyces mojaviensis]|uniref:Uncharacterized protein n=1 Tax=Neophaeococcomyces mojaviensis TaxID=3383035 RepID=A0ACC3A8T5_9EURO|nr:hypothetical protein H2198_004378 [Knufia sp. JES_112]
MTTKVVLLGLKTSIIEDAMEKVQDPAFEFVPCTKLAELKTALEKGDIAHVVMGSGLDIDSRLEAVRTVFETSNSTYVHMKKQDDGPQGYAPFIKMVLAGAKQKQTGIGTASMNVV